MTTLRAQTANPSEHQRIAMTGAAGFLGGILLRALVTRPNIEEIHVFDVKAPEIQSTKIHYHRLDLCRDAATSELAQILSKHEITTFLHGAFFSAPGRTYHREVESIGTFHVLNAVAEASVGRLLVFSSTYVYGAIAQHPNFLSEETPLRAQGSTFVRTRVDAEKQIQDFARDYPSTLTTVLRFAPILGPNSTNILSRYFIAGIIPKVMGYDPLLQFIHEDDALRATLLAYDNVAVGVFNIVGRGVLPLTTAIHMAGKIAVPVATPVCKSVFNLGFLAGAWDIRSDMMPFFKYVCVADGRRAERKLNFVARYSSRQALKAMIEATRLRNIGFPRPTSALGEDEPPAPSMGFERVY